VKGDRFWIADGGREAFRISDGGLRKRCQEWSRVVKGGQEQISDCGFRMAEEIGRMVKSRRTGQSEA